MATIDISKSHQLGKVKAREAAEAVASRLREKIQIDYHWQGDQLVFERSGAKGKIDVTDTNVRVQVDLGLLLRPMKGVVEEKIGHYLEKHLNQSS